MIGKIAHRGLNDKGKHAANSSKESDLSQCQRKRAGKGRKQRADKRVIEISCEVEQKQKKNYLKVKVS